MRFLVISNKIGYHIEKDNYKKAHDWAVNHLDCSREIVIRELNEVVNFIKEKTRG